ncbi:thiamine diphosphokinase [Virgibacillus ainsalahensis]
MVSIAIVGNGPEEYHPDFKVYKDKIDIWISADGGALSLMKNHIPIEFAVGDFDSVNEEEKMLIQNYVERFDEYPSEKDETDLEIALLKAFELQPDSIYLFGVTGGRLDHQLVNIQLLYSIVTKGFQGIIIDKSNFVELTLPGEYQIHHDEEYPNISFIPYSEHVFGLSLSGFKYSLLNQDISWGTTLCISNKLISNNGTFSYERGILLLVKSRDTIPVRFGL